MDRPDPAPAEGVTPGRFAHGLIVSCQAEPSDPFDSPPSIALFARAAELGGAAGIRACGAANVRAIRSVVSLPVIGLTKSAYPDGFVLITADFGDVEELAAAGAALVAVDATLRRRPNGLTGPEFVAQIKNRYGLPVMADVSTLDEGVAAVSAGADLVATTLAGFTPQTRGATAAGPAFSLLEALVARLPVPVILEGSVWTPEQARRGLELGAYAVVVGTAITRPRVITRAFVSQMAEVARARPE